MQQIDNLYSSDGLHPQHLLGASVVATYIYQHLLKIHQLSDKCTLNAIEIQRLFVDMYNICIDMV